jgi:collagen triple helix repeat protein
MQLDSQAVADVVVLAVKSALQPVLERLAASDARAEALQATVQELFGLRDRLVIVETKADLPLPSLPMGPDLTPVLERLAVVETKTERPMGLPLEAGIYDLVDRIVTLKMKSLQGERGPAGERGPEGHPGPPGPAGRDGRDGLQGLTGEKGLDGLSGKDGAPGRDGVNGKDGTAGLSFEGVYQEGKSYDLGHLVTWGGSSWHCNEPTDTKPGDGSKAWTLMVKRGRDGKDGKDATVIPVVSVGAR